MTEKPYLTTERVVIDKAWNPKYNQNYICDCGHVYSRHFDSYEEMAPVGCKYCDCSEFVHGYGLSRALTKSQTGERGPMSESMVEKVARAIQRADFEDSGIPWERINSEGQLDYRKYARASIEALRAPTDWMMMRGQVFMSTGGADQVFRAMISAALEETASEKTIREEMKEIEGISDPVMEALRRMLAEFGDEHYHTCPADDDSGPCDCFAGHLVVDARKALMAAWPPLRPRAILPGLDAAITEELADRLRDLMKEAK